MYHSVLIHSFNQYLLNSYSGPALEHLNRQSKVHAHLTFYLQEEKGTGVHSTGRHIIPFWLLVRQESSAQNTEGAQKFLSSLCTPMFIAAQFTIAKCWKQPKRPSVNEWIKKLWYIYTMEHYAAERKKELLPFATA